MLPPVHNKRSLLFFALIILSFSIVKSQYENSAFERYTVKDGLTDNYITCLQQDDRGYLWIGTDAGLNQFDGNSFTNYRQGTRNLPLLSGRIIKLKKFGPGQLGI